MSDGTLAVHRCSIDGLLLVDLQTVDDIGRPMADERGSFTEAWQTEKMQALGLPALEPKQLSVSRNRRGVIRGIHAEPWDKYIHVVVGRVFAPITDLRPGSPTFGRHEAFELDGSNALFVPKGLGNAFQALTDDVVYTYLVMGLFDAALSASGGYVAVNYADPEIGIDWPIVDGQVVSEKDRRNPSLREAVPSGS